MPSYGQRADPNQERQRAEPSAERQRPEPVVDHRQQPSAQFQSDYTKQALFDWNKQRSPRFVVGSGNIEEDSSREHLQIKPQAIEITKPVENFSRGQDQRYDQQQHYEQINQRRDKKDPDTK